jgi:hypothetical protein
MKKLILCIIFIVLFSVFIEASPYAVGGTESNQTINGINYIVHRITSTGTFNVTSGTLSIEALVVAGGGGGGMSIGGGGGAGGLLYNSSYSISGNNNVTIGAAGGGSGSKTSPGGTGGNSSLGTIIVAGGGGGGSQDGTTSRLGQPGGSGGGGGGYPGPSSRAGGASVAGPPRQGYDGGIGIGDSSNYFAGGGGGGAGQTGRNGTLRTNPGNGGNGLNFSINGTNMNYSGGGGGAGALLSVITSVGGSGGGGNGGNPPTAGTANTGGGGGSGITNVAGASGGTGVVIIRYLNPDNIILNTNTTVSNINNTFTYNTTPNFVGTVVMILGTWNVSLILNNVSYGIKNLVNSTGIFNITATTLASNTYYSWWFNATNNINSASTVISDTKYLFIAPVTCGTGTSSVKTCLFNNAFSIALNSITSCS